MRKLFLYSIIVCCLCAPAGILNAKTKKATRTIVDMAGRKVTIPQNIERIATSGTAQTQLILMLSGTEKLCATLPGIKNNLWIRKIYPGIMAIPAPFGPTIDIEGVVTAKPDVVTLWKGADELRTKIEALGIPVVIIYYDTPPEIEKAIQLMADLLGKKAQSKAKTFCNYYDKNIELVRKITSRIPEGEKKKIYYVTDTPLSTEGKNTMPDSWISLSGGVNVVAAAGIDGFKTVAMEEISLWNPDIIIVRDAPNIERITGDEKWQTINAVINHRVYLNPKGVNVWCARSADNALQPLWAAQQFYPDLFPDINIKNEVRYFYAQFYNYQLSDEEVERVIAAQPPL